MTNVNLHSPRKTIHRFLRENNLFADLSDDELQQVATNAQFIQIQETTDLFYDGSPANHYFLLISGKIEVFRYSSNGDELIFNTFGANHWVALAAMFMEHSRYPMNARCSSGTELLRLDRQPLLETCWHNAKLAMRMLSKLGSMLYKQINEVEWLTISKAPQRLARSLLQLSLQQGRSIELPMNQQQLAARLGIRAETLNRLLSDWQSHGYITGRGRAWVIHQDTFLAQLSRHSKRSF